MNRRGILTPADLGIRNENNPIAAATAPFDGQLPSFGTITFGNGDNIEQRCYTHGRSVSIVPTSKFFHNANQEFQQAMLKHSTTSRHGHKSLSSAMQEKSSIDLRSLDEFTGYQLRMAYIAISRHFAIAMAHLDLTQKQTGVLWLIAANSGVSQIALATELSMDRASMMTIVNRLEDRGLIVRKRSSRDGRKQELYATAKGHKTLAEAKIAIAGHEKWITDRFSNRELNAFVEALKRVRR